MGKIDIFVEGNVIGSLENQQIEVDNREEMEFYLRRGNRWYFRGVTGKLMVELQDPPKELQELKYHEKVKMKWT